MQPVSEPQAQMKSMGKKGDCGGSLRQGGVETSELVQKISRPLLLTDPFEACHLHSLVTEISAKRRELLPRIKFA